MASRLPKLQNLALAKKLVGALAIFILPVALMAYFLVTEKDDLITFTRQEIAGVHYLRAAQSVLYALTAIEPAQRDVAAAAEALKRAEASDAGALGAAQRAAALADALAAGGKSADDALAKATDLISYLSDSSNITLDPDADTYFVGDIIVNQATAILTQASALLGAAHDLDADPSDDHKIAYAEARDGVAAGASAFASDLAKAINGDADGSVHATLAAPGKAVAGAVETLAAAAKSGDRKALAAAEADLEQRVRGFNAAADDEMEHLLEARIAGFHALLRTRLGIAALCLLLGSIAAFLVVRSITKPLQLVTGLMGELTAGKLDIEIPRQDRGDEIGGLIVALRAFHEAALDRQAARVQEQQHSESERARVERIRALNEAFNGSVHHALSELDGAVGALNGMATGLAQDSEAASKRADAVAAAAQQTSGNVQTVASASEELSVSSKEIAGRLGSSSTIAQQAVAEAKETRAAVGQLTGATAKISEVVSLINEIAGQTNLLALNATIEAARAGDSGKGFAVVAQEVKTLANQTAKATDEISSHIAAVQEAGKNVALAIEHIDGVITQINEASLGISGAIEEQGAATQEIARNCQEAARGTAEVTSNVAQIAEAAQSGNKVSRSVLDAAKALNVEAKKLEQDVRVYLANIQQA